MNAIATLTPAATHRVAPWKLLNDADTLGVSDWNKARELAGLTWEPTEGPVLRSDADGMPVWRGMTEDGSPVYEVEDNHKRLMRGPGGATLGIVSHGYGTISNADTGRLIAPILDVPGTRFEHLTELDGGKKVFGLIRIGDGTPLPGDVSETMSYLCFMNSHDGRGAMRVWGSSTRLWCTNQVTASEATAKAASWHGTLKHSSRWMNNTRAIQALVTKARVQHLALTDAAQELADIKINATMAENFVRAYFPMPGASDFTERKVKGVERQRETLRELFESPTNAAIMGTAYGLATAAVEWADWGRRAQSADSLLVRNVVRHSDEKQRAWTLARDVVSLAA